MPDPIIETPAVVLENQVIHAYIRNFSMRGAAEELGIDKNKVFRILHSPGVQAKIQQILIEEDITIPMIRAELRKLAFHDPGEFYNDDGSLVPLSELSPETRSAITGIEVSEIFEGTGENRRHVGYLKKIRHVDRSANLMLLGKYLKMFTDKHELTGKDGAPLMAPPAIVVKFGAGE